jgi:hypothetical protein
MRAICRKNAQKPQKTSFFLRSLCLFAAIAFCISGCSIPNLEDPACTEARTAVREFYSFHFGNDMRVSDDNLKKRERFLTPRFFREISNEQEGTDPFTTGTTEFPKAFRVGECREISPDQAEFQVILFWRDDVRSEEREINAAVVKQEGKWLLDSVTR